MDILLGHVLAYFGGKSKQFTMAIAIVLLAIIGVTDYSTGTSISFGVFYLLPVSLVSWFVGSTAGVLFSGASAMTWYAAFVLAQPVPELHPLIVAWNAATRLGFFLAVAGLTSGLRSALDREKVLARTDFLTGATSARAFYELTGLELQRAKRYHHPVTLLYLDLDNFKQVNDQLGHAAGDNLLVKVVETLRQNLRSSDVVARLGGDEFAVLLPETGSAAGQSVASKAHTRLVAELHEDPWQVTVSIGVATCHEPPCDVDWLVRKADMLMYAAKNSGGNAIMYEVYTGAF